ncbi:MAG: DUF1837 domain-containing protein [Treponema sp.]|nr:DUF1837 domain-containing protein [Treponema sp.]
MNNIKFEILIDDTFYNLTQKGDNNRLKNILSEYNDYEDGKWRYERFEEYVLNNIGLTCLSASEREKVPDNSYSQLKLACKNLRILDTNDNGKGSEIAEIMLYGIMKDYYKAIPAVAKIFFKQNVNDYAKGSDGFHIVLTENDFSIWYGEAKFYKSLGKTQLTTIANSVFNSLNSNKLRKENITALDLADLSVVLKNCAQKDEILDYLSLNKSLDELKKKLHIPIMLLYECPITSSTTELTTEYKEKIYENQKEIAESYFPIQDEICQSIFKYDFITFHLICFPVPNKEIIVDSFINKANFFRDCN